MHLPILLLHQATTVGADAESWCWTVVVAVAVLLHQNHPHQEVGGVNDCRDILAPGRLYSGPDACRTPKPSSASTSRCCCWVAVVEVVAPRMRGDEKRNPLWSHRHQNLAPMSSGRRHEHWSS